MAGVRNIESELYGLGGTIVKRFQSSTDRRVHWVLGELGFAGIAFAAAHKAGGSGETLGHLLYFRLLSEISIRLSWAGRDALDPVKTVASIDSLMKRDLVNYQKAAKMTGGRGNLSVAEMLQELEAARTAPSQMDQLATEANAEGEYRYYRLASALVHAGAGLRTLRQYPPDATQINARECMVLCLAQASALLRILGLAGVPDDEIDRLASDGIFEVSPTVWMVRLQRELHRSEKSKGVRVVDMSAGMSQAPDGFTTLTVTGTFAGQDGRNKIEVSGADGEIVLAQMLERASGLR